MFKKHLLSLAIITLCSSNVLAAKFNPNSSGGAANSAPVANDDFDSVIVGLKPGAAGVVTSNDLNGDFVVLNSSATGTYGYLTLTSAGAYTYTLYENAVNAALFPGETVTDTFDYIYTKNPTASSPSTSSVSARLHIRITGGQDSLTANDDFVSFIVNLDSEITGDVTTNDLNGASVRLKSAPVSTYGILKLNTEGTFTYKLHKNPPAELTDLKTGELIKDEFEYIYLNKFGQETTAKLVVQIAGNAEKVNEDPVILDLTLSIVVNKFNDEGKLIVGYTGKVTAAGGGSITGNVLLKSSPVSDYGYLLLNSNGDYEYTYYKNAPKILDLKANDVVTDTFEYIYLDENNQARTSKLNVNIIGNPVDANGDTRFAFFGGDNVDVEFNNSASQATPLNSGRNIRGHIQQTGDQDWYTLSSSGNEVITLEMCPKGSECFREADSRLKNWVLYIFDSAKFTPQMENSTVELVNAFRLPRHTSSLYARYRAGLFDGALVGIIDPCFGTNNKVNIGVGDGEREYLIAVSTPLQGSSRNATGENKPIEECGVGSVFLSSLVTEERQVEVGNFSPPVFESQTVSGFDESIIYFPYSDDQYTIKITGTGVHPLLSPVAAAKSSTFNFDTGELSIPKIRVLNDLFQVDLNLQSSVARSSDKDDTLKFDLSAINLLGDEASDSYQATYNPANNEVLIPRVTDINSGKAYSVILKYHAATESAEQVLELIDVKEIK